VDLLGASVAARFAERVGVTLVRRSKSSNFKWSTWKWRFGLRGQTPPD